MRKSISLLLAAAAVALTANIAVADGGWNCDSPYQGAPDEYQGVAYGTSKWDSCYLDAAVAQCIAGKTVGPHIACTDASLDTNMKLGYKLNMVHSVCEQENEKGYLPEGVSEAACEKDWKTYAS